jgi:glycerol-3-phosphate dehydrogenase subunit B
MIDLLVVGAGFTGLLAAWLAARRGARTMLIAYGRGGLELSHGCLAISAAASLRDSIRTSKRPHPYALVGIESVERALEALLPLLAAEGLPYAGSLDTNMLLPTASGRTVVSAFAPAALASANLAGGSPFTIAGFNGFRDFDSALAARTLAAGLKRAVTSVDLPLPGPAPRRDRYATDLARLFEDPSWREMAARAWRPSLVGAALLGLPATLGLRLHQTVWQELQDRLEVPLFEIPTLPPSLPGLRLEWVLRQACQRAGVDILEGAPAVGRIERRQTRARVAGAVAMTAGGPRSFDSGAVMLATGGFLHGGLVARQSGLVQESVFDLPVVHNPDRSTWVSPHAGDTQPYASFGLRVDTSMRPLDSGGQPMFPNLFAAGGLLAGARRAEEGSRQGIALGTAFRAVEAALA